MYGPVSPAGPAVLILLVLGACRGPAAPSAPPSLPPDILLVTFDTTRQDYIDIDASDGTHTPTWAHMAQEGRWFHRAFAPAPLTLPSHTTLLTGTEPVFHGVHNNGSYRANPSLQTLPELLKNAGYSTGAVIAAYPLVSTFGLSQGFDVYDEEDLLTPGDGLDSFARRPAGEVTEAALALLARLPAPRFLWVHYFDAHRPWDPPSQFAKGRDLYTAEIAYTDAELGRLLEGFPVSPSGRITVLTADHGEGLGSHGEQTHGIFTHDATVRVPLLISGPGLPPGRDETHTARLSDVLPTVLALAGLDIPEEVQGLPLQETWSQASPLDPRPAYSESYAPEELAKMHRVEALRMGDLRLVRTTRDRLFDCGADIKELQDVAGHRPEDTARMAQALDHFLATHRGPLDRRGAEVLDEASREKLAALGYVWAEKGPQDTATLPDPYEHLDALVKGSKVPVDGDDPETYVRDTLAFLQKQPGLLSTWVNLVQFAEKHAERTSFEDVVGAMVDAQPRTMIAQAYAAKLAAEAQDRSAAAEHLTQAMEIRAQAHAAGRMPLELAEVRAAQAALLLGDSATAHGVLQSLPAPRLRPASLLLDRAILRHKAGELAAAVSDYKVYLDLHPENAAAWRQLAYAEAGAGRMMEALAPLARSLELDPTNLRAWARRAEIERSLGRAEDAARSCREHRWRGGVDPGCP